VDGGDLGFFPRGGKMYEPFARAAFALKPLQLSEPVATEVGYHLILAVDTKPGKEVKYEQRKAFVQEVFAEQMREQILGHYRAKSKIEIVERKK
jgi:parvulin-like peptidyl-prolyl isomerase